MKNWIPYSKWSDNRMFWEDTMLLEYPGQWIYDKNIPRNLMRRTNRSWPMDLRPPGCIYLIEHQLVHQHLSITKNFNEDLK